MKSVRCIHTGRYLLTQRRKLCLNPSPIHRSISLRENSSVGMIPEVVPLRRLMMINSHCPTAARIRTRSTNSKIDAVDNDKSSLSLSSPDENRHPESDKSETTTYPEIEGIHSSMEEEEEEEEPLKTRILQAALQQVKEHGWTRDALVAAVRQKFPQASPSLAGIVEPVDMVAFCMDEWNRRLHKELEEEEQALNSNSNNSTTNRSTLSPVDYIVSALKRRLEYQVEFVASRRWHQGMALGISTPQQAAMTTQQLKDLIQTVVHKTPPISVLSQAGLGAVYLATEFHMLADSSPQYRDTWNFLRLRVQDWYNASTVSSSHQKAAASGENKGDVSGLPFVPFGGISLPPASEALSLASTVASAFASGILSVVQVNPNGTWSALANLPRPTTPQPFFSSSTNRPGQEATVLDGTSPEHYATRSSETKR